MTIRTVFLTAACLGLAACSPGNAPSGNATSEAAPASSPAAAASLTAPAGNYTLERNHASLMFTVKHLGLAPYALRFTDFDAQMRIDGENPAQSSVRLSINPMSIRSDYPGDYKATHQKSPFATWDEALAKDERFLDAANHKSITFLSTDVSLTGENRLQVTGDLTLRGQTHPVTLDVQLTGMLEAHPFAGVPALGFVATGEFPRSRYGMTYLTDPEVVSDTVSLTFRGEFLQVTQTASN